MISYEENVKSVVLLHTQDFFTSLIKRPGTSE